MAEEKKEPTFTPLFEWEPPPKPDLRKRKMIPVIYELGDEAAYERDYEMVKVRDSKSKRPVVDMTIWKAIFYLLKKRGMTREKLEEEYFKTKEYADYQKMLDSRFRRPWIPGDPKPSAPPKLRRPTVVDKPKLRRPA